jgi:MoxR-like ATPase
MSRRKIDTSISFSTIDYDREPLKKQIEDPNVVGEFKTKEVDKEPYLFDDKLKQAIDIAIALGRPLLLQGEPGCGKTTLVYAVAYALGLPLEINYIKSTSRAKDLLYNFDAVNRIYDAQIRDKNSKEIDKRNYIRLAPLGRAIARASKHVKRRSVVLIDEIDKADLDFPNDLLWELDRMEFQIDEITEHTDTVVDNPPLQHTYSVGDNPHLRPIVIITHNGDKTLPTAFLRRCIFHYVEFPKDNDRLQEVLKVNEIQNVELSKKAIEIVLQLRQLDLSKKPGLSELVDWVRYLEFLKMPIEQLEQLPHVGALLKHNGDIDRARSLGDKSQDKDNG